MVRIFFVIIGMGMAVLGGGCAPSTAHIPVVHDFDSEKYLGRWYEIVRLPHRFEDGLCRVSATYSRVPGEDYIVVVNRGYDPVRQKWHEAVGRAVLCGEKGAGELRVSFFRPFWGDYRIIVLDADYQYAVVTSSSMDYFWILSRSPRMDDNITRMLISKAVEFGFDSSRFIMVEQ